MDPFRRQRSPRPNQGVDSTQERREVWRDELEGRNIVELSCQVCKKKIIRSRMDPSAAWVHSEDQVKFNGPNVVIQFEDHQALPDIIESTGREE